MPTEAPLPRMKRGTPQVGPDELLVTVTLESHRAQRSHAALGLVLNERNG